MPLTFDTLKLVKHLEESGIPEKQAEAFTEAFKDVQESNIEHLATKSDLEELQQATKVAFQKFQQEFKTELQELRQEFKTELQGLRQEFKTELQGLRQEFKTELQEFRYEIKLLKWMMGFMFAGVLSLVIKSFFS